MIAALALFLLASPAEATEVVLSAAGGRDFSTDQYWTGLDLAIYPDKQRGWSGYGRFTPAFGFADRVPFLELEGGVFGALPREGQDDIVRLGVIVSTLAVTTEYRLPSAFQVARGERYWGFLPAIEGAVEFEFFDEKPFVVGARIGPRPASSNHQCPTPDDIETCLVWFPGLTGGFYARGKLTQRLYLAGLVGPSPRLTVGYAF